nr:PAS domain S-box protein [Magnetospirillum sulfuroxidans]
MVNHSREAVYCLSPSQDFAITYANRATCALLGLSRREILSSPLTRFDPTMTRDWLDRVWMRIKSSDHPVLIETQLRAADGKFVPVEISASRLHHEDEEYVVGWLHDISSRQAAEQQLREREALYRASIEATIDGFWQVDSGGRIVDANSAYARLSGYSVAELCTMRIHDLEAAENGLDTEKRISLIAAQGALLFESQHRRKDGSIWEVEVNVLHSDLSGGRFFVYLRDLRRRRRADTLLKVRLHLAEVGRRGDMDGLLHEVTLAAQRLTASTTGFFQFTDAGNFNDDLPDICGEALRCGRPVIRNAEQAMGEDGSLHRLMVLPVVDETGFAAVIGVGDKASDYDDADVAILLELADIARDIANWVRAEQARQSLSAALAQTAHQWSVAMENFEGGIAVLDKDRRLLRGNAAFFSLTASSIDRIGTVMRGLAGNVAAVDVWFAADTLEIVLEADDPANPSHRPLEVRTASIRDVDGAGQGVVLSLYDLTRLREQERRLEQTIGELTRSNAELERFGQVAAHDLQEPTRRQVLFAQLLQRKLAGILDDESRQYLDFLISDALRMRDMVRALNVYHQAGQSVRPPECVDLDRVVADVLATLAAEIDGSHAQLCVSALGETRGERSRLHLLFVNLVSNALKFRRPGMAPRIAVSAEDCGDQVLLSVVDNGIGIPEEYRGDLFTLFRRLGSEAGLGSTGMGLAQCRRIVEDLGGRIWIEGNEQDGSTVKFTLPRL